MSMQFPEQIQIPAGGPDTGAPPGAGDLMAALGGGGGGIGLPAQAGGGALPSGGGGGVPGQPDNPDAEAALKAAIDSIHTYLSAEEDDQDKSVAAKCLAQLQGIMGTRQKQDEAALGTTPAHKAMGRAAKSSGGGGY